MLRSASHAGLLPHQRANCRDKWCRKGRLWRHNCLTCIACFIPLSSSYFLLGPYLTCPYVSGLYGSCQLPMTRIVDEQVGSLLSNKVTCIRNNSSLVNIRRLTPIIPFWFKTSKIKQALRAKNCNEKRLSFRVFRWDNNWLSHFLSAIKIKDQGAIDSGFSQYRTCRWENCGNTKEKFYKRATFNSILYEIKISRWCVSISSF